MKEGHKDKALREHVIYLLEGGGAHAKFDEVMAGIAPKLLEQKPSGLPHSLWMLLEHLRMAQWDILEFSRNPKHASPKWPEGYWPKTKAPPKAAGWNASVKKFRQDLRAMLDLVKDPKTGRNFHPGVTLAVDEIFGEVSMWGGFWAMQRQGKGWKKFSLKGMPVHYLLDTIAEVLDPNQCPDYGS